MDGQHQVVPSVAQMFARNAALLSAPQRRGYARAVYQRQNTPETFRGELSSWMKCVVRAFQDTDNRRDIIYEKWCYSFYELHIAVEEAVMTKPTVVLITEIK